MNTWQKYKDWFKRRSYRTRVREPSVSSSTDDVQSATSVKREQQNEESEKSEDDENKEKAQSVEEGENG